MGIFQTFTSLSLFIIYYKTKGELIRYKYWHNMVKTNRENFRREEKSRGRDENEIRKDLDDNLESEKLELDKNLEYNTLFRKGPFCAEFMLGHDEIDGDPKFYHLQTKLNY